MHTRQDYFTTCPRIGPHLDNSCLVGKKRTILVCANSDGSERYPLMTIGSVKQPRAFKERLTRSSVSTIGAAKGMDELPFVF